MLPGMIVLPFLHDTITAIIAVDQLFFSVSVYRCSMVVLLPVSHWMRHLNEKIRTPQEDIARGAKH